MYIYIQMLAAQSCLILCNPVDCKPHQAPLPMGFSRQEYWSGLSFPTPGDLPDPGIEPRSPALQVNSLSSEPPRKHIYIYIDIDIDRQIDNIYIYTYIILIFHLVTFW